MRSIAGASKMAAIILCLLANRRSRPAVDGRPSPVKERFGIGIAEA